MLYWIISDNVVVSFSAADFSIFSGVCYFHMEALHILELKGEMMFYSFNKFSSQRERGKEIPTNNKNKTHKTNTQMKKRKQ